MAPRKRKPTEKGNAFKKAKAEDLGDVKAKIEELVNGKGSYSDELGIDLKSGSSDAVFQWLCCSIIFGNRISEKTTIRAAKGLINCGLTDPKSVKEASFEEKVKALNSEGNVQRGPSMSERLSETASLILDKYEGDLNKLRDAANRDLAKEKKLLKEFKGIGEMGLNIFLREAQLVWEEAFPFADKRTLDMAKSRGLPSKSAKELAEHVDNDREKFVRLLGAVVKTDLRGEDEADKATEARGGTEEKADAQPKDNTPKNGVAGGTEGKAENEEDKVDDKEDKAEEKGGSEAKEEKLEEAKGTEASAVQAEGAEPKEKEAAGEQEDAEHAEGEETG